ncbi:MAG TPA: hypothetical protein VEA69_12105 [Tepidisphaeraceae bacterium]|nr:hypothetical protein [Tepidisphaeraceae bacterium]
MAIDVKPGQTVRVTIARHVNRAAALKTIERLFMKDHAIAGPLEARSKNFIPLPKRRGGTIWTKRVNKIHPELVKGVSATVKVTPQSAKDLNSVADFVEVSAK